MKRVKKKNPNVNSLPRTERIVFTKNQIRGDSLNQNFFNTCKGHPKGEKTFFKEQGRTIFDSSSSI